jgi:hypothetical protein
MYGGERRDAYRALVGKPEGRRPLERPRCRWEIILKWIFERLGGSCVYGDVPSGSTKCGNFLSSLGRF